MRDLRGDLKEFWLRAAGLPARTGLARAVQFIALHDGEGTTSVAMSFAMLAAARSTRTAWLVDLDLRRNGAMKALETRAGAAFGVPGRAYDAGLGTRAIYSLVPAGAAGGGGTPERLLVAHRIEGTRLLVTRFRTEKLHPGQQIRLSDSPDWWQALRKATDWIVVDSPALSRTRAGLAVSRLMDAVVIVAHADRSDESDILAMRREIEGAGGRVLGVVMNAARADARFLQRLFG